MLLTERDLDKRQNEAVDFILAGEDSLIAADVGTGKTVISLLAAKSSLEKGEVSRWLVLAPLLVATDTWGYECANWEPLQDLKVKIACGTAAQRLAMINDPSADIVVMNYDNLQWLLKTFPKKGKKDTLPFDGVIFDEIDKLNNVSTNRFKDLRNRVGLFKKRIGLTGTPLPKDLCQIWGQTYLIDGGHSFGRSFYQWRQQYFYPIDYNQYDWRPLPGTREMIIDKLSDITFRLKAKGMPELKIVKPAKLLLPAHVEDKYKKMDKHYLLPLSDVARRERIVEAANEGVKTVKLQQLCSGFSYVPPKKCLAHKCPVYKNKKGQYRCTKENHPVDNDTLWHTKRRFTWLEKCLNEIGNEQVLIFYHFEAERHELLKRYPGIGFLGNCVSKTSERKALDDWNKGELQYLALHPASASHGLNLQKSGAHHIVFITQPWTGGTLKQIIGRLRRRGQKAGTVFIHTAHFVGTVDETIFESVTERVNHLEDFLDELEIATA